AALPLCLCVFVVTTGPLVYSISRNKEVSISNSSAWVAFWRKYQAGGLSQRPSLFSKEDHPGLGVSLESVFGGEVRMWDQFRDLARSGRILFQNIRFYINGQRIEDPSDYLMRRNDGDFAGWHNRLTMWRVTTVSFSIAWKGHLVTILTESMSYSGLLSVN